MDISSEVFNKLPKGWEISYLGDIVEILDKYRKPINATEREQRLRNKSKEDLYPYYGATGQVGFIDGYLLDGEYILLGEDGAPFLDFGKNTAYIVKGKIWVNNHAHILKAYISNQYLCHYLNQVDYHDYVTGTTRLKLNQASMRQIPVMIPPLAEQHRIVEKIEELFSDLDDGIASLKKAQQQLKVYRQAVLKWAFEGKLTAQWREEQQRQGKLESAETLLAQIKAEREQRYQAELAQWQADVAAWEANGKAGKKQRKPGEPERSEPLSHTEISSLKLPQLPKEWRWYKIESLCDVVRGGSPRPAGNPMFYGGSIPFLKVADVTRSNSVYLRDYIAI